MLTCVEQMDLAIPTSYFTLQIRMDGPNIPVSGRLMMCPVVPRLRILVNQSAALRTTDQKY